MKTAAQLQAEIDDELRAKEWQARTERDELARRERVAAMDARPSQEQRYNERAADRAAGIEHGEKRGRASEFRRTPAQNRALAIALRHGQVNAGWNPDSGTAVVPATVLRALERAGLLKIERVGKAEEMAGRLTPAGAIAAQTTTATPGRARLTKAQIAKFRAELRKAVNSEIATIGGFSRLKHDNFERAAARAAKAANIDGRTAAQPGDEGVEVWEKVGDDTDIDSGQIGEYHMERERPNFCAYCDKPTRAGSMLLDEGQSAHKSCYDEFERRQR